MHDRLTIEQLNDAIVSGAIPLTQLSEQQISDWVLYDPDPLPMSSFTLSDPEQRVEFLWQYCYYGESLLLPAVAHIWDSLAEPRAWRCTQIGMASGVGGTGKMALVRMLGKMLLECSEIGAVLPAQADYAGPDDWHQAVMDHFANGPEQERALCQAYADILDGANNTSRVSRY